MLSDADLEEIRQGLRDGLRGPILLKWCQQLLAERDERAATPGFNNKILEQILTPDTVETRIGRLEFVDGVPTTETTQTVYDHLDFLRGVRSLPQLHSRRVSRGDTPRQRRSGGGSQQSGGHLRSTDGLQPLSLTGNTDTVYCSVVLDLEAGGAWRSRRRWRHTNLVDCNPA